MDKAGNKIKTQAKKKKQQAKSCKELGDPDEEDERKRTSLVL